MPYKTKKEKQEHDSRYYEDQRDNILARLKKKREADPEKYRAQKRDDYHRNKKRYRERIKEKHVEQKALAVEYLGGKCKHCGLEDDCINVYDFHHRDPAEKSYTIASKTLVFKSVKKELDKCDLLCANCHRKVHSGCERKI